jgi:hypothetical protein
VLGNARYLDVKFIHASIVTFLENAIEWLAEKNCYIVPGSNFNFSLPKFKKILKLFPPKDIGSHTAVNVYIFNAEVEPSYADVKALLRYVENGGSLLIGGQAWSFREPTLEYGANRYVHYTYLFKNHLDK